MALKSTAAKIFASFIHRRNQKWIQHPIAAQEKVRKHLIKKALRTDFGRDHHFESIHSYTDFKKRVPIRDYEALRLYVDKMVAGSSDVLWPGKPLYYAKTSGTTSGSKYIPITKESMPMHIKTARDAILNYIYQTGNSGFVDHKMIFLQGSPELSDKNGVQLGRLSGIVAHYIPSYLKKNRLPSWETNCIDDWETKVDAIVDETLMESMGIISGIPPWVQMYFEKLIKKTGKPIKEIFPNFKLFIYGGVNYEPYKSIFKKLIGTDIPSIELYPASEGFFAYQDQHNGVYEKGMLLQLDSGIFYEFIRVEDFLADKKEARICLKDVEIDVNYVMIISTTAGLWGYNIGDTVQFTSISPYRLRVSGRVKHYISAFGEHVIAKEVEESLKYAVLKTNAVVNEFTVAPMVNPDSGLPYHEWFVEFSDTDRCDKEAFANYLNEQMCIQNSYYKDLIDGNILKPLVVTVVINGGFRTYMKSLGKLGGQNKLPRLSNNRKIADKLQESLHKY